MGERSSVKAVVLGELFRPCGTAGGACGDQGAAREEKERVLLDSAPWRQTTGHREMRILPPRTVTIAWFSKASR